MERKIYLSKLVNSVAKAPSKDLIKHIGHFAYNTSNHKTFIELNVVTILQNLLKNSECRVYELVLGVLCNLSCNSLTHNVIDIPLIISFWDKVSIHGQRSISLILYNLNHFDPSLSSSDNQSQNILYLIQESSLARSPN